MTEETRPLPPAGWYPDPELPGEMRYWDGHAWGSRFGGPPTATREPRPVGRGFQRLAGLLGFLLVMALLLLVGRVALYVWGFLTIGEAVESGDVDMLTTLDDLDQALSVSTVIAVVVAGICWMFWQHRVARAVPGLERSPAMHAFSWIIPIGALWLPYQNVRDLWRRCVRGASTTTIRWWWAGWITAGLIGRLTSGAAGTTDTVSGVRVVLFFGAAGALIGVGAAALAIRIVRSVTAGAASGDFVSVRPIGTTGMPDAW